MSYPEFPDELRELIQGCMPDIDAVELLLLLSRHPRKDFRISDIASAMRGELTEAVIRNHLARLGACGLLRHDAGRYRFAPADARLRKAVGALEKLYNERPVTLVRTIYALRTDPVRAFSDAFKLKP